MIAGSMKPATNSWKEMASIPDGTDGTNIYGKRYYALSFGIGQYGYLGTGYNDNYQKDFWKFDPSVGDAGDMDSHEWIWRTRREWAVWPSS